MALEPYAGVAQYDIKRGRKAYPGEIGQSRAHCRLGTSLIASKSLLRKDD
jgi:hypothetical protein